MGDTRDRRLDNDSWPCVETKGGTTVGAEGGRGVLKTGAVSHGASFIEIGKIINWNRRGMELLLFIDGSATVWSICTVESLSLLLDGSDIQPK